MDTKEFGLGKKKSCFSPILSAITWNRWKFWISSTFFFSQISYLLTPIHLLTVPVTVARVGVHADKRTSRVCLVTRGNCQGWKGWCRGVGGGGGYQQRFYSTETPRIDMCMWHSATCDRVEHFFGKGGVHGVSMASNSPSPTHADVISRALWGEEWGRHRKGNIYLQYLILSWKCSISHNDFCKHKTKFTKFAGVTFQ